MKAPKTISGAHLFLLANDAGASSKSTFAAEARVACTMRGIPCRLVTFDASWNPLNQIFRGNGVHTVAKPNGDLMLETFGEHIEEASKAGEVIIADVPPCITDTDNPIMRAFSNSGILEEFKSIGLLVPITTNNHSMRGALDALAAYTSAGIKHDRLLVRAWRPEPISPTWESFPAFKILKAHFPIWDCSTYMQSMTHMMWAEGKYSEYPALDMLPKLFTENAHEMGTAERAKLRAAVAHLEMATDAIFEHLLAPIIEKPAKSAKSE